MKIYPAIDILGGKAVRLKQGRAADATVYGQPLDMARQWVTKGAKWLHVVDLDGAFEGKPKNIGLLRDIAAAVPTAQIERHLSEIPVPRRSASWRAPPCEKISLRPPQCGHRK